MTFINLFIIQKHQIPKKYLETLKKALKKNNKILSQNFDQTIGYRNLFIYNLYNGQKNHESKHILINNFLHQRLLTKIELT